MLIASKSMEEINRLKAQLSRTFNMKDLRAAKHILGMEIHRDRKNGKHWLSQQKYVEQLNVCDGIYIPNISHAFGVVSSFMANPGEEQWRAVKWVLRYLRGTSDHCIIFNGSEGSFCGYVDVDYAGDLDKRRSTTGYVFTLASGAISWMSKLQETVALSTTEAEYIVASDASKEAIWLKGLLDEIGRAHEKVNVLCDNQSVVHLATNPAYHNRTKHTDVRYHFLRHVLDGGKVALQKVHTRENYADIFTKPVIVEKLRRFLASLGLQKR
eukprot:PITA_07470